MCILVRDYTNFNGINRYFWKELCSRGKSLLSEPVWIVTNNSCWTASFDAASAWKCKCTKTCMPAWVYHEYVCKCVISRGGFMILWKGEFQGEIGPHSEGTGWWVGVVILDAMTEHVGIDELPKRLWYCRRSEPQILLYIYHKNTTHPWSASGKCMCDLYIYGEC